MKERIVVVVVSSPENAALARLTFPQFWNYTSERNYDLIALHRPKDDYLVHDLNYVSAILPLYSRVLLVDADVLITNSNVRLETIPSKHPAGVVMSREIEGRSPINAGISLWLNCISAYELIHKIVLASAFWSARPVDIYWQSFVAESPDLMRYVEVAGPRVLNSTDQGGEWHWEPGDFLCHFLGGTIESKIERVKEFIAANK